MATARPPTRTARGGDKRSPQRFPRYTCGPSPYAELALFHACHFGCIVGGGAAAHRATSEDLSDFRATRADHRPKESCSFIDQFVGVDLLGLLSFVQPGRRRERPRRRGRILKERRATSEANACPQLRDRCLTRRAQWFQKVHPQSGSDSSQLGDSTASTRTARGCDKRSPQLFPRYTCGPLPYAELALFHACHFGCSVGGGAASTRTARGGDKPDPQRFPPYMRGPSPYASIQSFINQFAGVGLPGLLVSFIQAGRRRERLSTAARSYS